MPHNVYQENFGEVPREFPRIKATYIGFQPIFSSVAYGGKYYSPLDTPPERWVRWRLCEDLALDAIIEVGQDPRVKGYWPVPEIIGELWQRVSNSTDLFPQERRWTMSRILALVGWERYVTVPQHAPDTLQSRLVALRELTAGTFAAPKCISEEELPKPR